MKDVILTAEGLAHLEQELVRLTTVYRAELAERLRQAREGGADLTENSEYLEAMAEQERLEKRIAVLEDRLRGARVVDAGELPVDRVAIGTTVRLRDLDANETLEYLVAGSAIANPAERKLSSESPVGKGILGHKTGETVVVEAPGGRLRFKILAVSRG